MGIMVYSLLWVMQDLYHQPYYQPSAKVKAQPVDAILDPDYFLRTGAFGEVLVRRVQTLPTGS